MPVVVLGDLCKMGRRDVVKSRRLSSTFSLSPVTPGTVGEI